MVGKNKGAQYFPPKTQFEHQQHYRANMIGIDADDLWSRFELELRIIEWAKEHDIPLEPSRVNKIEPTLVKPNNVTNYLQFQSKCSKCDSATKLAHFLHSLSTEEQTHQHTYALWVRKQLADSTFKTMDEMERKFIFLLALQTISDKQIEDNPFCPTRSEPSELLDFTESLALEQAFHGKTAQELEPLISLYLPESEQRQFKRQLLEILGGHHADLLTDPLSSPKRKVSRSMASIISKRALITEYNESSKLRRLSEIAIRRIQHHRVVDISDVQSQPRRGSFESQHSQQSPFSSFSQPPLTSPASLFITGSAGGGGVFGVKNYKRNENNNNKN